MHVTADADIIAVSGREITYHITAHDDAGEIGQCTHKRFLVGAERFLQKTYQKMEK
jgi:predicted thioesterase